MWEQVRHTLTGRDDPWHNPQPRLRLLAEEKRPDGECPVVLLVDPHSVTVGKPECDPTRVPQGVGGGTAEGFNDPLIARRWIEMDELALATIVSK
jgi:hypothetical protein